MSGNEFLPNYVEYLVPLQEKSKVLGKKIGIVAIVAALFVLIAVGSFTILSFIPGIIFFLLLGVAIVAWYLWRFVSVEYEYTILQGELAFDTIYGRRQRKKTYSVRIADIEEMGALNGKKCSAADFQGVKNEYFFASSYQNPNTWYAVAREKDGTKTLFFFEVFDKAEKALRFYHGAAIKR